MEPLFTVAGFAVGAIVGLTGVGGGALMTPLLMLGGVPAATAVGTDLLYAALTKASGVWFHHRAGNVRWRLVLLLAAGSLPAALLGILLLGRLDAAGFDYRRLITAVLSVSLVLTSLVLLARGAIERRATRRGSVTSNTMPVWQLVAAGALIGLLVSLSSVGAGALCAALLVLGYPRLAASRVVGTDLAHAVPLAALAGLGHLHLGNVDFVLLGSLLLGSLPGVALGARLATRLSENLLRRLLSALLLALGLGFAFAR